MFSPSDRVGTAQLAISPQAIVLPTARHAPERKCWGLTPDRPATRMRCAAIPTGRPLLFAKLDLHSS
jgi:hypothetical protein